LYLVEKKEIETLIQQSNNKLKIKRTAIQAQLATLSNILAAKKV
jgi:hypothetical protein